MTIDLVELFRTRFEITVVVEVILFRSCTAVGSLLVICFMCNNTIG